MSRFRRLREEFRQRRHHRAFRIPPPAIDEPLREQLEQLLAAVEPPEVAESPESSEPVLDLKALAEAATNLWRAQRKLEQSGDTISAQGRQTGRYLRTCRETLHEAGLEIQDHDGDPYHPGQSLEVLVFEPDPALTSEVVQETIRPSIYLHGERIQMGQVIVGTPKESPEGEQG